MPNNMDWHRIWRAGTNTQKELLRYYDEFYDPPTVSRRDESHLLLLLRVRWPSSIWKDWLALRIIPDLRSAFPAISHQRPLYVRRKRGQAL